MSNLSDELCRITGVTITPEMLAAIKSVVIRDYFTVKHTGVTREEVFKAIETLIRADKYPSQVAIRKQLGYRGSFSTIQKHIKSWFREAL